MRKIQKSIHPFQGRIAPNIALGYKKAEKQDLFLRFDYPAFTAGCCMKNCYLFR